MVDLQKNEDHSKGRIRACMASYCKFRIGNLSRDNFLLHNLSRDNFHWKSENSESEALQKRKKNQEKTEETHDAGLVMAYNGKSKSIYCR